MSSTKLTKGLSCAVCVIYADTGRYSWIVTKIERCPKGSGGKFTVRDEYADDERYETYVVEPNRIAPFPSSGEGYKPGDRVLALWKDEESNEWSTMFYEAKVIGMKPNGKVTLVYKETDTEIEVDDTKITRFPKDFDLVSSSEEGEEEENQNEATTAVEEKEKETKPAVSPMPTRSTATDKEKEKKKMSSQTQAIEGRRLKLWFNVPEPMEKPQIECHLTNEDFTKMAGEIRPPVRMHTKPGTPLLEALADPDLFSQERYTHVTGSGVISIPVTPSPADSALLSGPTKCGRIGWILNEWKVPQK